MALRRLEPPIPYIDCKCSQKCGLAKVSKSQNPLQNSAFFDGGDGGLEPPTPYMRSKETDCRNACFIRLFGPLSRFLPFFSPGATVLRIVSTAAPTKDLVQFRKPNRTR